MCLAEALLRIPDNATRDALIRDKISRGDWHSHLGNSPSMFVNAAVWGLMLTGKLTATSSEKSLATSLTRLIGAIEGCRDFDGAPESDSGGFVKNKHEIATRASFHLGWHIGHMSSLRRALGLPSAFS